MKNKFFAFLTFLLLAFLGATAQNNDGNNFNSYYTDHFANIVPPTPNAANFMQYGNTPVNASSGLPSISIPIYTIEEDGVQVPISISYNASGIKVSDISSTVGLKWSLNAGGMISRSVNDIDDFISTGWTLAGASSYFDQWLASNENYNYSDKFKRDNLRSFINNRDNFPDDFSYSFLNYSGSFMFEPNADIIYGDYTDQLVNSGTGRNGFGFDDLYGNKFAFSTYLESNEIVTTSYIENTSNVDTPRDINRTGWMLSNIETKNHKNIVFDYETYTYTYGDNLIVSQRLVSSYGQECLQSGDGYPLGSEREGAKWKYNHDIKGTKIKNITTNQLIRHINTENVKVEFIYTDGLVDGNSVDGWDKRIDRILIKDKIQDKQKEFHFGYGIYIGEPNGGKRLKLVSVQEKGFDNIWKPAYKFTYEIGNSGLPRPTSYGKDYKGYYNGQNNNTSLLPKTAFSLNRKIENNYGGNIIYHYPKYLRLADRYFNESFLKIGSLIEIEYPTGGKTEFTFEANAIGENLREPIIRAKDDNTITNFDNGNVRVWEDGTPDIYFGFNEYIYSTLVEIKDVVGQFVTHNLGDCVDCYTEACEKGCLEQPKLHIYKYYGDITDDPEDYFNPGKIGAAPVFEKTITTNDAQVNSFDSSEGNGVYIVMLLLGGNNGPSEYDPQLHNVNVWFRWHEKERDGNGDIVFQKNYLGGLRIKEIKDVDEDGAGYNLTRYNYISADIADEIDSEMNIIKAPGQSGLGGQLIYTSDRQWEHGTQTASGYCYTEIEIEKIGPSSYGKTIEYYEPKYAFYNLSGGDLSKKIVKNKDGYILFHEKTIFKGSEFGDIQMQFAIPSLQHQSYRQISSCLFVPPDHSVLTDKFVADYYDATAFQRYEGRWRLRDSVWTTQFLTVGNELKPVTTVKKYIYKTDPLLVEKEIIDTRYTAAVGTNGEITDYVLNNPNGEIIETDYQYVWEFKPAIPWTVPDGLPVSKEVFDLKDPNNGNDDLKVLGQYFEYDDEGNIKNTYRYNKGGGSHNGPSYVPPGAELDMSFLTDQGKPTQVRGQDGVITSYIWGYNGQYPVAKIVGLSYAQTMATPGLDLGIIDDPSTEDDLRDEVDKIRQHYSSAEVTTYTYIPLIGTSTVTDPKGIRVDYIYDGLGRLEYVMDQENNILGKNEYHYKTN